MTKRVTQYKPHSSVVRSEDSWPPQKVAELTRLYVVEGLSHEAIGLRMGLTKNTVIGKRARLGLVRDSGFVPTPQQAGRMKAAEFRAPSSTLNSRLDALDILPGFGKCAFLTGVRGAFKSCGADVPADNVLAPFCAEHQRVCWQTAAKATDNATRPFERRRSA